MALESTLPRITDQSLAPLVNDWSLQVATVNGSGSQSANMVLLRSIFQMGIPVSGKNLFPSNIAGLPTWFTIRANNKGYVGRKKELDLVVAMNAETFAEDQAGLEPGGAFVYNSDLRVATGLREDLILYPVPCSKLAGEVSPDVKLKKLLANMIYVGVVAYLLGIEMSEIHTAIRRQFKSKPKAADLNIEAVGKGFAYATQNLPKRDRLQVKRMDETAGKIIIEGNQAAALGAVFAGCTVVAWYPITPSSSLCETAISYLQSTRVDADGKATFGVIQAEDELAALGMVIGAGWAGARAMTATAGPGISLMAEFVGLAYFTEVPAVLFDVQRVGPSTGLPTRTAQGDISFVATLSNGDTKHIVLIPGNVSEAFEFGGTSFDLAERFQTLVFCMLDLDLGMNNWMAEPFPYPTTPIDRGKVLDAADLERIGSFARYKDVDGDGIPYRTLPGTNHHLAAYFTRGSGHSEEARYTEKPQDYKNLMDRLEKKHQTARRYVPKPIVEGSGHTVGIIAYGSTEQAMPEARDQLENAHGIPTDYLRVRALPFTQEVHDFVAAHERIYVVDQNRDAQMANLLRLDIPAEQTPKIRSVLHYDGMPIDARSISDEVRNRELKSPKEDSDTEDGAR